jgi:hypothetical protein
MEGATLSVFSTLVKAGARLAPAVLLLQACTATAPSATPSAAAPAVVARYRGPREQDVRAAFDAVPVNVRLETFATDNEFRIYLRRLEQINRRFNLAQLHGDAAPVLLAQQQQTCDPAVEECAELSEVQVTGTRIVNQSITNNQVAGVDEGDIVKSWGRFLVILHDARLFSVDLGEASGRMRLVDRVDAYQNSDTDAWYDELLIHGNQVLVTGYSYDSSQSEISIFDIDARGRLKLKSRFFIQSDDYFSGGNYASRLVDGKLVIYTPIDVRDLQQRVAKFPRIRAWTPKGGFSAWQTMLEATDIYKPVDRTLSPTIHAISVCPILSAAGTKCRSTGILAAGSHDLYVSPEGAYLWVNAEMRRNYLWSGDNCDEVGGNARVSARPATLYQLPFDEENDAVTAVRTHGDPPDQFSMERSAGMFHALVRRVPAECYSRDAVPLELFSFPLWQFTDMPSPVGESRVHAMPVVGQGTISARFSANYLTYGAGRGWWRVRWRDKEPLEGDSPFVTVPLGDPRHPRVHTLQHSIERVELLGDNVVTFGATADGALGVTTLDLRVKPAPVSTLRLPGVVESEGRSHAFNADVQPDGSAVFGLPTAVPDGTKDRWGRNEYSEHVHFFSASAALRVDPAGSLPGDQLPDNPAYECEVSCIDWYGNARPIFYRGRIFALLGREFVEGRLEGGGIREIGRMDLTLPPARGH